MGLDMYLERFPRYKDYGVKNIRAFEDHREWEKSGGLKENGSFEDWGSYGYDYLPKEEDMPFFESLVSTKYWDWDKEHKFPHERIYEQVAYWRKANAIHQWFVVNVQDYEDDCEYHDEVTKEKLEELRDICKKILEEVVLIKGKVKNGYRLGKNGKEEPIYEDGFLVLNPKICEELLPTEDGFFFGSTEYNQWYMDEVKYTYEKINKILEETDFDNQMIYYCSSW